MSMAEFQSPCVYVYFGESHHKSLMETPNLCKKKNLILKKVFTPAWRSFCEEELMHTNAPHLHFFLFGELAKDSAHIGTETSSWFVETDGVTLILES